MWVSRTLKCPLTIHGLDSGESHESRWRRSDVWLARCGLLCLISFAQLYLTLCDSMDCACQAPLSMEFSRQKYWSGLPFPPPKGSFPPRNPTHIFCICLLHWQEDSLPDEPLGKPSRDDWLTPNFNIWLFSQKESQSWESGIKAGDHISQPSGNLHGCLTPFSLRKWEQKLYAWLLGQFQIKSQVSGPGPLFSFL